MLETNEPVSMCSCPLLGDKGDGLILSLDKDKIRPSPLSPEKDSSGKGPQKYGVAGEQ